MDEFTPTETARDEIQQRIDVLRSRINGYNADQIQRTREELHRLERGMAEDKARLAEWEKVAATVDQGGPFPRVNGETIDLGPECFADDSATVVCWRGKTYRLDA